MRSEQPLALGAAWVWCGPGDLRAGAWVVLGRGRVADIADRPPAGARLKDLGQGLLMPGLVNAHTHLELSFLAGLAPPAGDFVGWVERLVRARPGHDRPDAREAALRAARDMAESGVACVGDITNTGRAREALARAGLSAVSFFEALGARAAEPPQAAMRWAGGRLDASAAAAHAPYSVPARRIQALKARSGPLPFCLHLAESQAEMEFFAGCGPEGERLAAFLEARGFRREEAGITARRPLAHLMNLGVVDQNTLLVHGVQLNRGEARDLAGAGASLCLCPRSNLGLAGDMAPAPDLLAAGVNLALGTDSLASSPDLSLWAEMAALLERFPGLDPEAALTMATQGGARALGLGGVFGRIQKGAVGVLAFAPLTGGLAAGDVIEAAARGETAGPPARAAG